MSEASFISKNGDLLFSKNNEKTQKSKKVHVADDIYLIDHTVPLNDRRLTDAYNSRTRIRRLTGFDSSLLRDRVWAVKTNNDISKGLARVEKIERQMKQHEQGRNRAYDAEKLNLERRLSRISSGSKAKTSNKPQCSNKEFCKFQETNNSKISSYLKSLEPLLLKKSPKNTNSSSLFFKKTLDEVKNANDEEIIKRVHFDTY